MRKFRKKHFWGDPKIYGDFILFIEIPYLFIENPLFFDISNNPYHSEKIDHADSEFRTPEAKFRLFMLTSLWVFQNFGIPRKRALKATKLCPH